MYPLTKAHSLRIKALTSYLSLNACRYTHELARQPEKRLRLIGQNSI